MTAPTYFTVIADFKSVVVDLATDANADPELGPITAKVTFTPMLRSGDVILAATASPRPIGFVPAPIVARIDTDGRLKLRVDPDGLRDDFSTFSALPAIGYSNKVYFTIDTQKFYRWNGSGYTETYDYAPVRLLAQTDLLALDPDTPLCYQVTFSDVVYNGGPGYIAPFTFQAPTTDLELNLITVMRVPGQRADGIMRIAPGAIRVVDGQFVFSFGGVDIDDPIDLDAITISVTADGISDATAVGKALIRAANAAAARAAIGAEASANKGQPNGYAPLNADGQIDGALLTPIFADADGGAAVSFTLFL